MTVSPIINPRATKLRNRIADLRSLQQRIADEIEVAAAELREVTRPPDRKYRRRGIRPDCGTETGYQWHRYHEAHAWPLPTDDPCGCRAAHAEHQRIRDAIKRVKKVA